MNFERKRSTDVHLKLLDCTLRSEFELGTVQKLCAGDAKTNNRIIQGDNLEVLSYLATTNPASVRCVYLDPPYNNGESYKHYFDSMGHDEWLSAVTSRVSLAKALLRNDGSLWISIDDSELHYLKVSCDSVFGRQNFVGTVIWEGVHPRFHGHLR
jgi:adenine-specific DNA-methyltransferase